MVYQIKRCLNKRLQEICLRSIELEALNYKISRYIPKSMREHFCVSSFNNGCLVLATSDPVWANQIRFSLPEIRDKLRKEEKIYQLTAVKVKIIEPINDKFQPQKSERKMSNNAITAIDAIIDTCSYEPLKEALKNLGKKNRNN